MKFKYNMQVTNERHVCDLQNCKWYDIVPIPVLTAGWIPRACDAIRVFNSQRIYAKCTDDYIALYTGIGRYEEMNFPVEYVELL